MTSVFFLDQKASDQKLAEAATVKPSYDDNDYLLPTESKAPGNNAKMFSCQAVVYEETSGVLSLTGYRFYVITSDDPLIGFGCSLIVMANNRLEPVMIKRLT